MSLPKHERFTRPVSWLEPERAGAHPRTKGARCSTGGHRYRLRSPRRVSRSAAVAAGIFTRGQRIGRPFESQPEGNGARGGRLWGAFLRSARRLCCQACAPECACTPQGVYGSPQVKDRCAGECVCLRGQRGVANLGFRMARTVGRGHLGPGAREAESCSGTFPWDRTSCATQADCFSRNASSDSFPAAISSSACSQMAVIAGSAMA